MTDDAEVFDRAGLYERLAGDEELVREILAMFLEEGPASIESLRAALADGDADLARRHAHSLKGAAANVAAEALRAVAQEAEKAAAEGDLIRTGERLGAIDLEYRRLGEALAASGLVD